MVENYKVGKLVASQLMHYTCRPFAEMCGNSTGCPMVDSVSFPDGFDNSALVQILVVFVCLIQRLSFCVRVARWCIQVGTIPSRGVPDDSSQGAIPDENLPPQRGSAGAYLSGHPQGCPPKLRISSVLLQVHI